MAGSEFNFGPRQERLQAAEGQLGDWIAPIIAFVMFGGMWLAVICVLLAPAAVGGWSGGVVPPGYPLARWGSPQRAHNQNYLW
jgi:hypothetical protein